MPDIHDKWMSGFRRNFIRECTIMGWCSRHSFSFRLLLKDTNFSLFTFSESSCIVIYLNSMYWWSDKLCAYCVFHVSLLELYKFGRNRIIWWLVARKIYFWSFIRFVTKLVIVMQEAVLILIARGISVVVLVLLCMRSLTIERWRLFSSQQIYTLLI